MNSFVIKAIVDELNRWFCPGVIKKIVQSDSKTFWLQVKGEKEGWMTLCLSDSAPRLYCRYDDPKGGLLKTPFLKILSKNLVGGRITAIEVGDFERVVRFTIEPHRLGHTLRPLCLILELIKHNALLSVVESDSNKILYCSKTYRRPQRSIMPGQLYIPLVHHSKLDPLEISKQEWNDLLSRWSAKEKLSGYLVDILFGLSPLIADEIVFRAGLSPLLSPLTEAIITRLRRSLDEIIDMYFSSSIYPVVICLPDQNRPPILNSFQLKSMEGTGNHITFSTMNGAAEFFFKTFDQMMSIAQLRAAIIRTLKRAEDKTKNRLSSLQGDLKRLDGAEQAKEYADLIMAHLKNIKKGMNEVTLCDLFHGGEITLPLDPAKEPIQNAQEYLKRYGKAKRGRAIILKRKTETDNLLLQLNDIERLLKESKTLKELSYIEMDLKKLLGDEKRVYKSSLRPATYNRKAEKQLAGIRVFKIDEDWTVMVGKTAKDNDYLTSKVAKPQDFWFHVYNARGSHVVLRNPKRVKNVSIDILKKAAAVAAFFSRQRNQEKVMVSYTNKRYVKKSKGQKPGQVFLERQKTLNVQPSLEGVEHV